jgi:hypothetical protein
MSDVRVGRLLRLLRGGQSRPREQRQPRHAGKSQKEGTNVHQAHLGFFIRPRNRGLDDRVGLCRIYTRRTAFRREELVREMRGIGGRSAAELSTSPGIKAADSEGAAFGDAGVRIGG